MTKLFGLCLVAAAGLTGCGALHGEYRKRGAELTALITTLKFIRAELETSLSPLPELLKKAGAGSESLSKDFLLSLAELCRLIGELDFYAIWETSITKYYMHLNERELKPVKELGRVLGKYDAGTQTRELTHCIELLDEEYKCFENSRRRDEHYKLEMICAVCALIMIVLA